jgi:hypothetical protein
VSHVVGSALRLARFRSALCLTVFVVPFQCCCGAFRRVCVCVFCLGFARRDVVPSVSCLPLCISASSIQRRACVPASLVPPWSEGRCWLKGRRCKERVLFVCCVFRSGEVFQRLNNLLE